MGTSISHGSPRTPKWKPLHTCYENPNIPEHKVLNEVWRAADNPAEDMRWSDELKSEVIFSCLNTINSSDEISKAIKGFSQIILESKNNSIASELAKRSIPAAFNTEKPQTEWAARLFSEITNYIISRDTSGFVGENYRNKTVQELSNFKNNITSFLYTKISDNPINITSKDDWDSFVDSTITTLKSN
ncbi:MAG: hypothetical protein ACMZ7B_00595 [Balneola sp.]